MGWFDERFDERPRRVRFDCLHCGRGMWFPKCKVGKYKTCGSVCAEQYRASKELARQRNCVTCGTAFIQRQFQLSVGHGRYCSQKCNVDAHKAMNQPDAQVRSRIAFASAVEHGRYVPAAGPSNNRWKGGKKESVRRRQENGKLLAGCKAYRAANKDKVREFSARRSGRKIGRLPKGTVKRLGELQRWKCAICTVSVRHRYHVDHIIPLARGGMHEPLNIQLLCPSCNVRKSAKDPIAYMQERGFLL